MGRSRDPFGKLLRPALPAVPTPPAPALVGADRVEQDAAWDQARHHADDLVADTRNHQPLAGHEAVIARLGDFLGGPPEQPRWRRRVDTGTQLEFGLDRTGAERGDLHAERLDLERH